MATALFDALGLAGLAAITYGAWLYSPPSAYIVVGLAAVIVAGLGAKNYKRG